MFTCLTITEFAVGQMDEQTDGKSCLRRKYQQQRIISSV